MIIFLLLEFRAFYELAFFVGIYKKPFKRRKQLTISGKCFVLMLNLMWNKFQI